MPIRLSDIVAKVAVIDVEIAGESIRVEYKPNSITLRRSNELQRLIESMDDNPDIDIGRETAHMFCDLVSGWDIVTDDGQQYPINIESLQDFPANILMQILESVQEDVSANGKKTKGVTSDDTSAQTGSLAPVQNGIR